LVSTRYAWSLSDVLSFTTLGHPDRRLPISPPGHITRWVCYYSCVYCFLPNLETIQWLKSKPLTQWPRTIVIAMVFVNCHGPNKWFCDLLCALLGNFCQYYWVVDYFVDVAQRSCIGD